MLIDSYGTTTNRLQIKPFQQSMTFWSK